MSSDAAPTGDLFDRFQVIDVDTHITEPADVWTSRIAKKWHERIPHIVRQGGKDVCVLDGQEPSAKGQFGVRMFGVLRFVIQSFFLALEKATGGNAEPQNIEQANFEGKPFDLCSRRNFL